MCTPMKKNNWERGELRIGSLTFGELIKKAHFFSHAVLPAPLSHSLHRAATPDSVIKTLSEACCSLILSRQSGDTHSPALEPRCSGRRARLLSPCQVWDCLFLLSSRHYPSCLCHCPPFSVRCLSPSFYLLFLSHRHFLPLCIHLSVISVLSFFCPASACVVC